MSATPFLLSHTSGNSYRNVVLAQVCVNFCFRHRGHIDSDLIFLKNYVFRAYSHPPEFLKMELLLNLAWLLLALPAYWLWRERSSARAGRRSLQCLLSLGCMLVILFPVVSATDDLHAMRAEMEESPLSKRSICQKAGDKGSACHSQPILVAASICFPIHHEEWRVVPSSSFSVPPAPTVPTTARAPPASRG